MMKGKKILQILKNKLALSFQMLQKKYAVLQETAENQKNNYLNLLKEHEDWKLLLIQNNPVLRQICLDEVIHELEEKEWEAFEKNFNLMYPFFILKLKQACPEILKIEIRTCCLVKLKMRTKRIAGLLGQRENTVSKRKKDILKKYFCDSKAQSLDEVFLNEL